MATFVIAAMATFFTADPVEANGFSWKTGPAFELAMTQPLSATWENVELRRILYRIQETREISLVLDRRIDPNQEFRREAVNEALREFLDSLAKQAQGEFRTFGNAGYLGPADSCRRLRTLAALRREELSSASDPLERARRGKLLAVANYGWPDFAEPRQILQEFASAVELEIDGLDKIPHDLWAAGLLPDSDIIDALSIVLIQFDLTFRWTRGGTGIELVPVPNTVTIAREHAVPKGSPTQAARQWEAAVPGIETTIKGGQVLVVGTIEQHEAVEAIVRPPSVAATTNTPPAVAPLAMREFTLKIQEVPVKALIAHLEKSGIRFSFDNDAFKAAGVSFDKRISLDVTRVKAQEFFAAIFDPLDLKFEIDGVTVKLSLR